MKLLFLSMMILSLIAGFWNPWHFLFSLAWGVGYFLLRVREESEQYNEMYRERHRYNKEGGEK